MTEQTSQAASVCTKRVKTAEGNASAPMVSILYADEWVVAVDKPAGLATIPEGDSGRPCLIRLVEDELAQRLYAVHRLDKDASGVLLFARSAGAHRFLNDQFSLRRIHKVYVALVQGEIGNPAGVIDCALREFGSGRVAVDRTRGKPSLTRYTIEERLGGCTLVEAEPETGRRHQLRVHFYHIGHPIAGDRLYGDRLQQLAFPRLMLHAASVTFQLPNGRQVTATAPPGDGFEAVLALLRNAGQVSMGRQV